MSSRSKILAFGAVVLALSCVKPLDRNNPADPEGNNFKPTVVPIKRMFVTSTFHSGPIGGLAVADSICQTRADAVPLGGTWKAWLSTSTVNAVDRIPVALWEESAVCCLHGVDDCRGLAMALLAV